MVGVWEGLNLGSIPNFFLCFGMHPKIINVYPKLIPKGGVVQFCPRYHRLKKMGRMILLDRSIKNGIKIEGKIFSSETYLKLCVCCYWVTAGSA